MGQEVVPMIRLRPALFSFSLLAAAACGGTVAQPEPTSQATAAEATRAPVAVQAHGIVHAVGAALGEVPLRPDQRTEIEKLAADAEARHGQVAQARNDFLAALAGQVEQGTVDRPALQPKVDAVTAAMQAARPADQAAFERLHAILDPSQRVAFVNALEAHAHEGHDDGARPGGAHHEGMRAWARDLHLTDDQKTQIKDGMRARFGERDRAHEEEHHHGEGHGGHMLEAFKSDHFVMAELAPPGAAEGRVHAIEERLLGMAEVAVPILTPEQRTLAAQKLRARAAGGAEGEAF
jgi:Spy/CpxP family protein refolding chaperone